MSYRASRLPSGFASNGVHRNILGARRVAQPVNPLINPCPVCDAPRYVRCHRVVAGVTITGIRYGGFIYILDTPHAERVTSKTTEQ